MLRSSLIAFLTVLNWEAPSQAQTLRAPNLKALQQQVFKTENAFAKAMATRDFRAFESFLSQEAVFFSGPVPLRGKAAVAAFWKQFFEKPEAPFSWEPERVEVLESGTLALSTGPVRDPRVPLQEALRPSGARRSPGSGASYWTRAMPALDQGLGFPASNHAYWIIWAKCFPARESCCRTAGVWPLPKMAQ